MLVPVRELGVLLRGEHTMLFLGRAAWLVAGLLAYAPVLYSYPFAQSMMEVVAERVPTGTPTSAAQRPALPAAQLLDQTKTGTMSGCKPQPVHKKKPMSGWFGGWFKKK